MRYRNRQLRFTPAMIERLCRLEDPSLIYELCRAGQILVARLTPDEYRAATLLAAGHGTSDIGELLGWGNNYGARFREIYRKLDLEDSIALIQIWNCELFQTGLRELGLVTGEPNDTDTTLVGGSMPIPGHDPVAGLLDHFQRR